MQTESRQFACAEPGCGRVLSSQADLDRHTKNRHIGGVSNPSANFAKQKKSDYEKKTDQEGPVAGLSQSNLSTSPTTELGDLKTLESSVGELISNLKSSKSGLQSDEMIYARSLIEVEREKAEKFQRVSTSDELIAWRDKLTRDYVMGFAKQSPENGEYEALELIEVLKINSVQMAYFGDTEDFSVGDLMTLRELDLSDNRIGALTVLHRLTQLETLNISKNSLSVLSGLSDCKSLKRLNVSHNMLESLDDMRGLRNLEVLDAGCNKMKDLDSTLVCLQSLKSLKELRLKGNPVERSLTAVGPAVRIQVPGDLEEETRPTRRRTHLRGQLRDRQGISEALFEFQK